MGTATQGPGRHAVPDARHRRPAARPPTTPTSPRPPSPSPSPHLPARPPAAAEFLARLDQAWLETAYAGDWPRLSAVRAAAKHLPDIALRYRTLLDRLGPGFDGTHTLGDADAWYLILEGTSQHSVASAQALAVTELLAHAATSLQHRAAGDPAGLR